MATRRSSIRDRVRKKAQESQSGGGGGWLNVPGDTEFYEHKKGEQVIDIVPYEVTVSNHPIEGVQPGDIWYQRWVWVHYDVGAQGKAYVCPALTNNTKCPMCEHRAQLMAESSTATPERAAELKPMIESLKPSQREIFNVREDGEVKLWTLSFHLFGRKLDEELSEGPEEYASAFDMEGGYLVKARFQSTSVGSGKPFLKCSRIDFLPREVDLDDSILEQTWDLDKVFTLLSYDQLYNIYWGNRFRRHSRRGTNPGTPSSQESSGKDPGCQETQAQARSNTGTGGRSW
jgi:hypothetical protein